MNRKVILGSIIGCSIGAAIMSAGFLFAGKIKNGKLVYSLSLAASIALCIGGIMFLKLRSKLRNKLLDACECGDTAKVESLLKLGVSANLKNRHDDSLLYIAVQKGHVEIAKLLLAHGADVDFIHFRDTLLHLAAANGHIEMVRLLVENGANVNAVGIYSYTPLHKATQCAGLNVNSQWYSYHNGNSTDDRNIHSKYTETAEFLIKNGANIDAKGIDNIRPLRFAISSGLSEIVILLLRKGADANLSSIEQQHSFTPICHLLLAGIDKYASGRNYLKTFFTLLAFGANLTEEHMEQINDTLYLKDCLTAFEEIKEMPHLGKIIRGYGERNLEVMLDYIAKNSNNRDNVIQLTQELQSIRERYNSNRCQSFIPETLLDIIKYMEEQYVNQCKKIKFKIGALSSLICEAIENQFGQGVSLEDIISPRVASTLSDQDAVNLSLVSKFINSKANDRAGSESIGKLLTQLEKRVMTSNANAEVGGPQLGG